MVTSLKSEDRAITRSSPVIALPFREDIRQSTQSCTAPPRAKSFHRPFPRWHAPVHGIAAVEILAAAALLDGGGVPCCEGPEMSQNTVAHSGACHHQIIRNILPGRDPAPTHSFWKEPPWPASFTSHSRLTTSR